MKFSQDMLLKLAAGGAAGYLGASFLMPKPMGFAKAQSCPSGKYCKGICCNHITSKMIQDDPGIAEGDCQSACGWTLEQSDDYWRWATSDPHGAAIGAPYQAAKNASSPPPSGGPGGGGGGDDWLKSLTDAFNSSANWLGSNVGMPVLIVGGLVLAVVLISK